MKTRTIFVIALSFALILFATNCFATDNAGNGAMSGVQNVLEGAGNGVRNVVNGTGNVVEDAANGIGRGIGNIGNSIDEGMNNMDNTNNGDYTAQRTATTAENNGTFLGMNSTVWTWVIMGIIGAAIISLVWFYGKQHEDGYKPNHDDNY